MIAAALVASIPDADKGFRFDLLAKPFPDFQKKLTWLHGDSEGNTYKLDDPPLEGWICPALFKYYDKPPAELFLARRAAAEVGRSSETRATSLARPAPPQLISNVNTAGRPHLRQLV